MPDPPRVEHDVARSAGVTIALNKFRWFSWSECRSFFCGFLILPHRPGHASPHQWWVLPFQANRYKIGSYWRLLIRTAKREGVLGPDDEGRLCHPPHERLTACINSLEDMACRSPRAYASIGVNAACKKGSKILAEIVIEMGRWVAHFCLFAVGVIDAIGAGQCVSPSPFSSAINTA